MIYLFPRSFAERPRTDPLHSYCTQKIMVVRNRFMNGQILSSVGKRAIAEKHGTREFRLVVFPFLSRDHQRRRHPRGSIDQMKN